MMNVLIFSRDKTLFRGDDNYGNFPERLLEYSKYANLFVIACADRNGEKRIAENVYAYGIHSNPLRYVPRAVQLAFKISKKRRIDVVTSQDPFASGVAALIARKHLRAPVVVQLHADFLDNHFWLSERMENRFLNALGKYVVKRADSVRTVSARLSDYAKSIGCKTVSEAPVYTDVSKYMNNKEKPLGKFSKFRHKVLFVGRLVSQKNISLLIASAALVLKEHPDTAFIIVGDGPQRKMLEKMAAPYKKNIFFEGAATSILPYYATCDVFALPSNYEGWGLVLIEAMASGKPVVTTDVGCAGEMVIEGENGLIVKERTPKEFARAIIRLLSDEGLRTRMGAAGRDKVTKELSKEKNAGQFMSILESAALVKGTRPKRIKSGKA